MKLIQLIDVSKSFYSKGGRESKILKNIDLEIEAGELIGITGPSGSGKTTLLNILGCVSCVTEGDYYINNQKVDLGNQKLVQKIKNQMIGFIEQDFKLLDELNVYDNIMLPLLFNEEISFNEIDGKIKRALIRVGLPQKANEKTEYLSGGEKQRVAIARAIVIEPSIILADEPTGALDIATSDNIINLLKEINQTGTTIIIVTHNKLIAKECDREIVLRDGKID